MRPVSMHGDHLIKWSQMLLLLHVLWIQCYLKPKKYGFTKLKNLVEAN